MARRREHLTRARERVTHRGLTVTPGHIQTGITDSWAADAQKWIDQFLDMTPLGRGGRKMTESHWVSTGPTGRRVRAWSSKRRAALPPTAEANSTPRS